MALTKVTGDFIKDGVLTQAHLHTSHGITTAHIGEGSNLYFTNARVDSRIGDLSTSNLSEGSNLYYTDARARAAISVSGNALSYNSSTGVITSNFEESPTFTGAVVGASFSAAGGFLNGSNGGIRIHSSGTKFFNITAANAARDGVMDIGASDARFKDLYLSGNITASGYNNSNWDTAYTYSQVGHLPLTGGTINGILEVNNVLYTRNILRVLNSAGTGWHTWATRAAGKYDLNVNNITAAAITASGNVTGANLNISNWDTAYGWGNHASAGYLTSFDITTQTDPKYLRSNAEDTTTGSLIIDNDWNSGTYTDSFTIYGTYPSFTLRSTNSNSNTGSTFLFHTDSTGDIQYYFDTGGPNENWTKRFSFYNNGRFDALTQTRTPILYDSNNTGYYVDPASTTNLNTLTIGGVTTINNTLTMGNGFYIQSANGSGKILLSGNLHIDSHNGNDIYINYYAGARRFRVYNGSSAERFRVDTDGITYAFHQLRTPIIYDYNDTSRYLDPNVTSRIDKLEIANTVNQDSPGAYLKIGSDGFIFGGNNSGYEANSAQISAGYHTANSLNFVGMGTTSSNRRMDFWAEGGFHVSGIIYDKDSTGFYIDPTGTTNLSKAVFNTAGTGLPRQITIKENGDTENSMGSYPGNWTSALNIQSNDGSTYLWLSPLTSNIPRIQTNYGQLDFYLGNNTNRALHLSGTSARSSIFYDIDNTGYYVDPASTSNLNALNVGGYAVAYAYLSNNKTYTSTGNAAGSYLGGHYSSGGTEKPNSGTFGAGKLKLAMLGSSNLGFGGSWNDVLWMSSYTGGDVKRSTALVSSKYDNTSLWIVKQNYDSSSWGTGYLIPVYGVNPGSGTLYATTFYDSNNTGFYLDPASTSHINEIFIDGRISFRDSVSTDDGRGLYFEGNGFSTAYAIFREGGGWSNPYPDLRIAFHTGIKLGAAAGYNGIRFYTDYDMSSQVMSVNNGSDALGGGNVYVNNSLQAGSSLRAPIFYDSNDTGYYIDPNSSGTSAILRGYQIFNDYGAGIVGTYSAGRYQLVFAMGNAYKGALNGTSVSGGYGLWWSHPNAGGVAANLNSHGLMAIDNGNWQASFAGSTRAAIDMRAPIFYDQNNTGYYMDPASTSFISNLNMNGNIEIRRTDPTIYFRDTDHNSAMLHTNSNIFYILRGGTDTTSWSTVNGHWPLEINLTNNQATFGGIVQAITDMRAPVFYDRNNTVYYTDPGGTSKMSVIEVGASGYSNIWLGGQSGNYFRFHTNNTNTYFDGNCGDIHWRQGSSTRFYFYMTTANMTINGTLTQYSDERLKQNVVTIDNALNKVNQLRGVYYNRTDINTQANQIGLIAQETESVIPEVVHTANDELGTKSISYGQLNALLVEAIKEQQTIIDDLKSRIETLENQ